MSTRSMIGKLVEGRVRYIYCQYDGYLKAVGDTLLNSYADEEHLDKLLDLGNISRLGNHPVSFPFMWDFFNPLALSEELTRAYKDRGEKDVESKMAESVDDFLSKSKEIVEYCYLYDPSQKSWSYCKVSDGNLKPLTQDEIDKSDEDL